MDFRTALSLIALKGYDIRADYFPKRNTFAALTLHLRESNTKYYSFSFMFRRLPRTKVRGKRDHRCSLYRASRRIRAGFSG